MSGRERPGLAARCGGAGRGGLLAAIAGGV